MTDIDRLEQAIAAIEAQRAVLGDEIVEASLAALREQLGTLKTPVHPDKQQRKLVTILFATLPGFSALSEMLDAEEARNQINLLWQHLDATITAYGGVIDKHIGGRIMALWGTPEGREDDAERAVRAALAMQAQMARLDAPGATTTGDLWQQISSDNGEPAPAMHLSLRIGINTGSVLLGEVGTRREFTAMGDAVNLASRLEEMTPAGKVYISHDTYRHVQGLFDVQALEPVQVKGKSEAVQAYLVERARPRRFRAGGRGVEGIVTRLVGRAAELDNLKNTLQQVSRSRLPQFITLTGEAGIGKSRLLYEFESWANPSFPGCAILKGRANQEMQHLPFSLLRDSFALAFQIQDSDSTEAVWRKMEQGIGEPLKAHFIGQLLGFDFSQSPYLQNVLGKAGTPADPRQLHDRALSYIHGYFEELANRQTVIILLEDVHWADDGSLDAMTDLAQRMAAQPLMVICTARPLLFERRPTWGSRSTFHIRLDLLPLSQEDSQLLVKDILKNLEDIPESLSDTIINAAEGNPYYL